MILSAREGRVALWLAGATVVFVGLLQHSLVLVPRGGLLLHWASILLVVPAVQGVAAALLCPRAPYKITFLASLAAATVLLALYATVFWRTPPERRYAVALFVSLSFASVLGVSLFQLFTGRRIRGVSRKNAHAAKRALLALYHIVAVVSAIVTIVAFLR